MDGYCAKIKLGRPDLDRIFKETQERALASGVSRVAVLCCGPSKMIDSVYKMCWKYSEPIKKNRNLPRKSTQAKGNNNTETGDLQVTFDGSKRSINAQSKSFSNLEKKIGKVTFDFHSETFDF